MSVANAQPSRADIALRWAIWYPGATGCRVFPLAGKIPPPGFKWRDRAATGEAAIRQLWAQHPCANVGLVAAKDVLILDVDAQGADHKFDGPAELAKLEAEHGALPRTPTSITGSGGRHLFFRLPKGVEHGNGRGNLPKGLDIRAGGKGYVVVHPSVHPTTGTAYQWIEGLRPDEVEMAQVPAWFLAISNPPRELAPVVPLRPYDGDDTRNHKRALAYLAGMPPAVSKSEGHAALFDAACALVRGFALPNAEAIDLLIAEYNPRCKPPWSRKDIEHKVKTAAKDSTRAVGYLRDKDRPGWTPKARARAQRGSQAPAWDSGVPSAGEESGGESAQGKPEHKVTDSKPLAWNFLELQRDHLLWLAGFAHRLGGDAPRLAAAALTGEALRAYNAGAKMLRQGGGAAARPAAITDAVQKRVKRRLQGIGGRTIEARGEWTVEVKRLIRRPVLHRATYDMVIEASGKTAEIRRLTGAELGSYKTIRDRAIESGLVLPSSRAATHRAWADTLEHAMEDVRVQPVDPEGALVLAIMAEIRRILQQAERGESLDDLKRGGIIIADDGFYALPAVLVKKIRVNLQDDRPMREDIIDAIHALHAIDRRPRLANEKSRPRVLMFPLQLLKDEDNE